MHLQKLAETIGTGVYYTESGHHKMQEPGAFDLLDVNLHLSGKVLSVFAKFNIMYIPHILKDPSK